MLSATPPNVKVPAPVLVIPPLPETTPEIVIKFAAVFAVKIKEEVSIEPVRVMSPAPVACTSALAPKVIGPGYVARLVA